MPLKWERGTNPYVHNYFGKLRLGPNAARGQILAQAKNLIQQLTASETVELGGQKLDDHAINEASKKLLDPGPLAQELLLVHPQNQRTSNQLKMLLEKLRQLAVLPEDPRPLDLVHPAALLWFVPAPGVEAAELPEWEAFGLVEPGQEPDAQLDIVFDS